jgi:hypothetical protein
VGRKNGFLSGCHPARKVRLRLSNLCFDGKKSFISISNSSLPAVLCMSVFPSLNLVSCQCSPSSNDFSHNKPSIKFQRKERCSANLLNRKVLSVRPFSFHSLHVLPEELLPMRNAAEKGDVEHLTDTTKRKRPEANGIPGECSSHIQHWHA